MGVARDSEGDARVARRRARKISVDRTENTTRCPPELLDQRTTIAGRFVSSEIHKLWADWDRCAFREWGFAEPLE